VHTFYATQLKLDFDNAKAPVVAAEFVTTSITSESWPQERIDQYLPDNPHVLLADSRFRGYTRVDVGPKRFQVDLRRMETAQRRDAACSTLASFVVEDGRAGPLRA
jgi:alkaline phosphatase D